MKIRDWNGYQATIICNFLKPLEAWRDVYSTNGINGMGVLDDWRPFNCNTTSLTIGVPPQQDADSQSRGQFVRPWSSKMSLRCFGAPKHLRRYVSTPAFGAASFRVSPDVGIANWKLQWTKWPPQLCPWSCACPVWRKRRPHTRNMRSYSTMRGTTFRPVGQNLQKNLVK